MEYNLINNIENCYSGISPLIYYSHIPTSLIALLLGIYVNSKKRTLASALLLVISLLFTLWNISDLVVWTSVDGGIVMIFWSTLYILQGMILAFTLYFSYVFLEERDVSIQKKIFSGVLLSPLVLSMPTTLLLTGFDTTICEARQGPLVHYFYFLQGIFLVWTLLYLVRKYLTVSDTNEKKRVIIFSIGIFLFLFSFSWGNIFGSLTLEWGSEQYGLFGMPVFLAFLTYLIVRYKAFDIKLLGAQALIISQFVLIGSMFFFAKSMINQVLTIITLVITSGAGWFMVRSLKREFERKEELQVMSDRLALANQELKRLDNAKSEFISIASHQLRTPLTAIKGYTSLILEGNYGKIDNQLQDVISKVYTANGRLIELVENLLSISRLESGRMQYNFQPTQAEEIVKDLENMFFVIAKKRGLDFSVVFPEEPLPKVSLDAAKIREVISNLIDNAIKYTEKGSITVTLWQNGDTLRFSVKDTGIGVTSEDKIRLFSKFARSKETEKLYVGGTGLGLYVGKTFIEKHGGRIWVESDGRGRGSEFIFELPISRDSL